MKLLPKFIDLHFDRAAIFGSDEQNSRAGPVTKVFIAFRARTVLARKKRFKFIHA